MIDEAIWCPSLKFHTHTWNIKRYSIMVGGGEKMMRKIAKILLVLVVSVLSIGGVSAGSPDILIHPDTSIITVGVDPNPVSPPLDIEYLDWGTNVAAYSWEVHRVADDIIPTGCSGGGTITGNDFHPDLTSCVIPATDIGEPYEVIAEAHCGGCAPNSRSRLLVVDADVNPVPELSTVVLMSAGLIGLLGIVRLRRKN